MSTNKCLGCGSNEVPVFLYFCRTCLASGNHDDDNVSQFEDSINVYNDMVEDCRDYEVDEEWSVLDAI